MSLGGRVAEETVFGEITTGASNDLEQATELARVMVTRYGMSEKLGPRTFGKREELVFLGKEISERRDYSDKIAEDIDNEVQKLIKAAYNKAKKTIESNSEKLRVVAEDLIKNETINGDKFNKLVNTQIEYLDALRHLPLTDIKFQKGLKNLALVTENIFLE